MPTTTRPAGGGGRRRLGHAVLPGVSALLADAFRGRASRANFRTGTLTMCTMLPMRSVPHRVVCLLGADDGVFPRSVRLDGDDITERDPWVGDRDPRSEDRQLLLDALLAAEERLLVIYRRHRPAHRRAGSRRRCRSAPCWTPWTRRRVRADGRRDPRAGHRPPSAAALRPEQLPRRASGPPAGFSFDRASLRGVRAAGAARPDRRRPPVFTVDALPPAAGRPRPSGWPT